MCASLQIATAVKILSPVTILTVTPARLHASIASGTPSRNGSIIPTKHTKIKSDSISSGYSALNVSVDLYANINVLNDYFANYSIVYKIDSFESKLAI